MQKIDIWSYEKMVLGQPRICHLKWDAKTFQGLWDINGSPNRDQTTRPCNNQHEKENMPTCGLCCPGW